MRSRRGRPAISTQAQTALMCFGSVVSSLAASNPAELAAAAESGPSTGPGSSITSAASMSTSASPSTERTWGARPVVMTPICGANSVCRPRPAA